MVEELKIQINDYKEIEKKLLKLGAKFVREINVVDTYFRQPKGKVLKITEDDLGNFLVRLRLKSGKFEILEYRPIKKVDLKKSALSQKYGIKCIIKKKRRFFDYKGYNLNFNLIDGVGVFLIIEGKNVNPEIIYKDLEIRSPKFIHVSFDELKCKKSTNK